MPIEAKTDAVTLTLIWEPSLPEKLAPVASALGLIFLGTLFLDGLFLGGNGLTWLKIALSTRIPRPFLGEGTNLDWAERKRAEIVKDGAEVPRKVYEPGEALPWLRSSEGNHQHPSVSSDAGADRDHEVDQARGYADEPDIKPRHRRDGFVHKPPPHCPDECARNPNGGREENITPLCLC